MFQVVVLPPPEALGALEEFRRRHDPAFHRLPAHVLVLGPFDPADERALDRFDTVAAPEPFVVELGAPELRDDGLYLPAWRGLDQLETLRADLAEALVGPDADVAATPPSLRVGRFGIAAEAELVARSLSAAGLPRPFTVDTLTLVLEDERAIWHPVRRRHLDAP